MGISLFVDATSSSMVWGVLLENAVPWLGQHVSGLSVFGCCLGRYLSNSVSIGSLLSRYQVLLLATFEHGRVV